MVSEAIRFCLYLEESCRRNIPELENKDSYKFICATDACCHLSYYMFSTKTKTVAHKGPKSSTIHQTFFLKETCSGFMLIHSFSTFITFYESRSLKYFTVLKIQLILKMTGCPWVQGCRFMTFQSLSAAQGHTLLHNTNMDIVNNLHVLIKAVTSRGYGTTVNSILQK